MSHDTSNTLTDDPVKDFSRLTFWQSHIEILKISAPILVFVMAEMSIVPIDIIMVGALGETQLATLGIAGGLAEICIMFILGAVGMSASLLSQSIAQNNQPHTQAGINALVAMTAFLAVLVFIPFLFSGFIFDVLQQPQPLKEDYMNYMDIFRWGLPFLCFAAMYRGFFNAFQINYALPLAGVLIPCFNILFNYMFIYGNFGAPALGVTGAAYATILTDFLIFVLFVVILKTNPKTAPYDFFTGVLQTRWRTFKHTLAVSTPLSLSYVAEMVLWTFSTIAVGWIGIQAMAAHQSLITAVYIITSIGISIGVAFSIVGGNLAGHKNMHGLRKLTHIAISNALFFALLLTPIMLSAGEKLIAIAFPELTADTQSLAITLLPYGVALSVFYNLQYITASLIKGINHTANMLKIYIAFYLITGIGLCYGLSQTWQMGILGVWWGMIIATIICSFICIWYYGRTLQSVDKTFQHVLYADDAK